MKIKIPTMTTYLPMVVHKHWLSLVNGCYAPEPPHVSTTTLINVFNTRFGNRRVSVSNTVQLVMWTTFDMYYQVDSEPQIILYMLEPADWVATLALYDPELINYTYTTVSEYLPLD